MIRNRGAIIVVSTGWVLAVLTGCHAHSQTKTAASSFSVESMLTGRNVAVFCDDRNLNTCTAVQTFLKTKGAQTLAGREIIPSGDPFTVESRKMLKSSNADYIVRISSMIQADQKQYQQDSERRRKEMIRALRGVGLNAAQSQGSMIVNDTSSESSHISFASVDMPQARSNGEDFMHGLAGEAANAALVGALQALVSK